MSTEFLDPTACNGLTAGCLVYPSAGSDTVVPLATFLPWIREFWFIDTHYDLNRRFTTAHDLEDDRREILTGTTLRRGEPFQVAVRHERYRWSADGQLVTIHRCRGRGYDLFRTAFAAPKRQFSVFFHRGDSPGEGGSNFYWLGRKRLPQVLECLEPGGLVVSDGSNAMRWFRCRDRAAELGPGGIPKPFRVGTRRFVCVGYLGHRNGPTLVWKTESL